MSTSTTTLPLAHIADGNFIMYNNHETNGGHDCAALICEIDKEKKIFHIIPFNDMVMHRIAYSFEVSEGASNSRKSMRPADRTEALEYIAKVRNNLDDPLAKALTHGEALAFFDQRVEELKLQA